MPVVFGARRKREKAVERALAVLLHDGSAGGYLPIEQLPPQHRLEALLELARRLSREDETELALATVKRALAAAPDEREALELSADLELELGRVDGAIHAWKHIVGLAPQDEEAAGTLARLLIDADRAAEALELLADYDAEESPDLALRLGEALYVSDRSDEALPLLEQVCETFERALRLAMGPEWQAVKVRLDEAERLRDDVHAELHGREGTIEAPLRKGKLDARAGVNYTLLGASLAAKSSYVPSRLALETPADSERRAKGLLARNGKDPSGLVMLGAARLRQGNLADARRLFEDAREADAGFPAFFGIGAALDYERHRVFRRVEDLPARPAPDRLQDIVPDLPALTAEEKRVVCASIYPLRGMLRVLRERSARARILPIDVRVTDLPELADVAGERAKDDFRSYDALGGVATPGCAVAKIEQLLDVVSPAGWTFAHEFAHLALHHAPEAVFERVDRLYERALGVGYACDEYQLENIDEFFAVSYTDFLRAEYRLPVVKEVDEDGVADAIVALFRDLAKQDELTGR